MTNENGKEQSEASPREYSRKELEAFIAEISSKVVGSSNAYMHSLLAINHLLRASNAEELLDAELKEQLRDLWVKLKSNGLQLADPPLLFGIPDSQKSNSTVSESGSTTVSSAMGSD